MILLFVLVSKIFNLVVRDVLTNVQRKPCLSNIYKDNKKYLTSLPGASNSILSKDLTGTHNSYVLVGFGGYFLT